MNTRTLAYWTTTGLFTVALGASGLMTLTRQAPMVAGYEHLGYPLYLMTILGVWKLLGVAALASPRLPRLKEWAYAGFTFNLTGAVASHLATGDAPAQIVAPVVLLGLLAASWSLRPQSRTLASAALSSGAAPRPALA